MYEEAWNVVECMDLLTWLFKYCALNFRRRWPTLCSYILPSMLLLLFKSYTECVCYSDSVMHLLQAIYAADAAAILAVRKSHVACPIQSGQPHISTAPATMQPLCYPMLLPVSLEYISNVLR